MSEMSAKDQLTRAIILPQQVALIDQCLQRLVDNCVGSCAFLLDRSGQMITSRGDGCEGNLVLLGALIGGSFASAREIARLLGEDQFQTLFQQGQKQHIMTSAVGSQWLLSVIFGRKTQMGLVRVLSSQTVGELCGILRDSRLGSGVEGASLGGSFHFSAAQAVDSLFGERFGTKSEE